LVFEIKFSCPTNKKIVFSKKTRKELFPRVFKKIPEKQNDWWLGLQTASSIQQVLVNGLGAE
jgi:hypothetical protein